MKKAKVLGAIGTNDNSLQFLEKENDFISSNGGGSSCGNNSSGTTIENKNKHLCYELGSGNVNKMPSIIEDRTEEGSDAEEMKSILKKEQGKKKGDKLSKLHIGKFGNDLTSEDSNSKKVDDYTSMPYSPFSTNFELFKNNVIENLPVRSGLGSHRNSISCTYDILTNLSNYNNARRGSLPALSYSSYPNHNGLSSSTNEFVTPSHSTGISSSSSVSYSSTNASTSSSSLSSPSSNSTMVNQSNGNPDIHSFGFNQLNFNQKTNSVPFSSASTPSATASDSIKGKIKTRIIK